MSHRGTRRTQIFGLKNQVKERLKKYIQQKKETQVPLTVIFDVGTKAIRILIGSKHISNASWVQQDFFNDAILTHLGSDIGFDGTVKQNSLALKKIIHFVNEYYKQLKDTIDINDFFVIGTAAFRWMKNRDEIISYFQSQTKLTLRVFSQEEEARFSLCAVMATYNMRRPVFPLEEDTEAVIMLLDQGGGSMEVSYTEMNLTHMGLHSFDDLGSIALRKRLFEMGPNDTPIDPNTNRNRISTQQQQVQNHIEKRVQEWEGYPEIKGKNIYLYALGSAASCLFQGSNFDAHNRVIQKEAMIARIREASQSMNTNAEYVSTLYKEVRATTASRKNKQEENLLLLCGVSAYVEVMEKFGVDELRMCGYGLRYGVLVGLNRYNASIP